MKKILGLLVIVSVVLGLTTGCSMNVPVSNVSDVSAPTRNNIEWVSNVESRAAETTLDEVTIEVYRVPIGNTMNNGKEYQYTKKLHRGEKLRVETNKDYNYEYYSCIRVVDFDWNNPIVSERDEINFFDYEDDLVMEIVNYYSGPLEHIEEEDGWTRIWRTVYYRGEQEGYTAKYVFLNGSEEAISKFYDEHKDGGRIVWNNN